MLGKFLTLEQDPWGRPYRIVLGKMRARPPLLTETLDTSVLENVLDALFLNAQDETHVPRSQPASLTPSSVTEEELARALSKMRKKNTAPGPDGIPGYALALSLTELNQRVRKLYDRYLQTGSFPRKRKMVKLILIQKPGRRSPEAPSSYKPIFLLDEMGKLLKRIVAYRINSYLLQTGPAITDNQLGFPVRHYMIDAIDRVINHAQSVASQGGMALAVLIIVNAFNSLLWNKIIRALLSRGLPRM